MSMCVIFKFVDLCISFLTLVVFRKKKHSSVPELNRPDIVGRFYFPYTVVNYVLRISNSY